MKHLDNQIIRSANQLAQRECANYANGSCLLDECPCYAVNPAYRTIHDGAISCDYFLKAVQPSDQELNTAVWHEIFREEGAASEGWKVCIRCQKPFIPASNRQRLCRECGNIISRTANRERQRRFRERKKAAPT